MKKSDLKYGNVIETRNGDKYLVAYGYTDKVLVNLNDGIWVSTPITSCYKEDLTNVDYFDIDIMKVYKNYTLTELLWERKEPKLTEDEKVILRNIYKEYKWITRDEEGYLTVHNVKPYKSPEFWVSESDIAWEYLVPFNNLFQFIKWEDEEPYSIEELLKGK